jgi:iron complex outermembrane recepter protein
VFPTTGASGFNQYLPVNQESLLAFEPGFKLKLLDNTMQLNGAIFYYKYTDKQLQTRFKDPVFGELDTVQNIPKSSVKGAELEIMYRPIAALTLNGSMSFIKAKVDDFNCTSPCSNAVDQSGDFSGADIPYTPKFQFNLSGDYTIPVSGSMNAFVGSTVSYRSSTTSIIGGNIDPPGSVSSVSGNLFDIKSYTLVDLRGGLEGDDWRVFLWGKNVGNTYYWNNVNSSFDVIVRYAGMPATYGITASYKVK